MFLLDVAADKTSVGLYEAMATVAAAIAKATNARVDAELCWPPCSAFLDSLEDQLAAGVLFPELDHVRLKHPG